MNSPASFLLQYRRVNRPTNLPQILQDNHRKTLRPSQVGNHHSSRRPFLPTHRLRSQAVTPQPNRHHIRLRRRQQFPRYNLRPNPRLSLLHNRLLIQRRNHRCSLRTNHLHNRWRYPLRSPPESRPVSRPRNHRGNLCPTLRPDRRRSHLVDPLPNHLSSHQQHQQYNLHQGRLYNHQRNHQHNHQYSPRETHHYNLLNNPHLIQRQCLLSL